LITTAAKKILVVTMEILFGAKNQGRKNTETSLLCRFQKPNSRQVKIVVAMRMMCALSAMQLITTAATKFFWYRR
jgi:hypothetical protein